MHSVVHPDTQAENTSLSVRSASSPSLSPSSPHFLLRFRTRENAGGAAFGDALCWNGVGPLGVFATARSGLLSSAYASPSKLVRMCCTNASTRRRLIRLC